MSSKTIQYLSLLSGSAFLKVKPTMITKMLIGCDIATLVSGVPVTEHMYNQGRQAASTDFNKHSPKESKTSLKKTLLKKQEKQSSEISGDQTI